MKTNALKPKFQKGRPFSCPSLLCFYTFFTYSEGSFAPLEKHISLQKNTIARDPSGCRSGRRPSQANQNEIRNQKSVQSTFPSQVSAITIFTPKKISRSILSSFTSFPPVKIPRSVNKSTQVPAISDFFHQNPDSCTANLLFTQSDLAAPIFSFQPSTLNPVPSLHLRRKYLISSFFFVTKRSKTEAFQSTFAPFGPNHTSNCSAGIGHLVLVIPLSFVPLSFVIRRATLPSFSLAPHRAAPHLVGGWRASTSITNRPRRFCLKCRKPWRRTCAINSAPLPHSTRKDSPPAK